MAGSFSYHGGHTFEATQAIKAGDEIFADYGETWLDNREGTFADFVPREDDFRKAASLFNKIHRETFENKVHLTDAIMKTYKAIASTMDVRVGSILPDTATKFKSLSKEQYRSRNRPLKTLLAENTIEKRNLEWIQENGICLDLVRPGKSTIPHAGQGAFAQGYIAKDTIISPGPLLNIKDRNLLKLYNSDDEVVGEQLLLNYCFGHVKSPLLLCPQTNMILMNHCSIRKPGQGHCGEKGPNAKVRWGTSWDPDTPEWLKLSLEEVVERTENQRRGLSLEVVATRDIHPGEEVLIDYGENWENALEEHLNEWEPPEDDGTYVPVRTLINNNDFRTLEELEENPYPENAINVCYFQNDGYEDEEIEEIEEDEIVQIEKDGSKFIAEGGMDIQDYVYECDILEKYLDTDKTVYTVRVLYSDEKHFILTDYPEESIAFRMKSYKSDTFLSGAFRHFIEIDDDIFPNQWKIYTLEEEEEEEEEEEK
jgi:SET domain.